MWLDVGGAGGGSVSISWGFVFFYTYVSLLRKKSDREHLNAYIAELCSYDAERPRRFNSHRPNYRL